MVWFLGDNVSSEAKFALELVKLKERVGLRHVVGVSIVLFLPILADFKWLLCTNFTDLGLSLALLIDIGEKVRNPSSILVSFSSSGLIGTVPGMYRLCTNSFSLFSICFSISFSIYLVDLS
jgi:hypothetical protein